MNSMVASNKWATVPPENRWGSLTALLAFVLALRQSTVTARSDWSALRFEPNGNNGLAVRGMSAVATLSAYAFERFCAYLGSPVDYLRRKPLETVVRLLNEDLDARAEQLAANQALLLLQRPAESGDTFRTRTVTTSAFGRIWDSDVVAKLIELEEQGWRVPPARPAFPNQPGTRIATEADVLAMDGMLSVKVGDMIAPAGIYHSDRDLWVIMVDHKRPIEVNGQLLYRILIARNSEVGDGHSAGMDGGLINHVCGNHILHGLQRVCSFRVVHRGRAQHRFELSHSAVRRFAESSTATETAIIGRAMQMQIADSREAVIDTLYGNRRIGMTKGTIEAAYDAAETYEHAPWNPRSVWGMVQGATLVSQRLPYTRERMLVDAAAGRLLDMAR